MKTVTFNPDKKDITVHRGEETTDSETGSWWGKTICGMSFSDDDYVDTDHAGYSHNISYCKKCYGLSQRGGKRKGSGRPKGSAIPPEKRKNNHVQIRFSSRQLERIQAAADVEEIPYTRFIRRAAINAANMLLDDEAL